MRVKNRTLKTLVVLPALLAFSLVALAPAAPAQETPQGDTAGSVQKEGGKSGAEDSGAEDAEKGQSELKKCPQPQMTADISLPVSFVGSMQGLLYALNRLADEMVTYEAN